MWSWSLNGAHLRSLHGFRVVARGSVPMRPWDTRGQAVRERMTLPHLWLCETVESWERPKGTKSGSNRIGKKALLSSNPWFSGANCANCWARSWVLDTVLRNRYSVAEQNGMSSWGILEGTEHQEIAFTDRCRLESRGVGNLVRIVCNWSGARPFESRGIPSPSLDCYIYTYVLLKS